MAYVCGLLTREEKETLERRGWDIESGPIELLPDPEHAQPLALIGPDSAYFVVDNQIWCMVWVDSDMFQIMSGPDWKSEEILGSQN